MKAAATLARACVRCRKRPTLRLTVVHATDNPLASRRGRRSDVIALVLSGFPPGGSLLPLLLVVSLHLAEGIILRVLKDRRQTKPGGSDRTAFGYVSSHGAEVALSLVAILEAR